MRWLPILLLIPACGPAKPDPDASGTVPLDELGPRWAVLEAQDHRNTTALCAFLQDSSVVIRRYAALALASVQDSASRPCMITALKEPEATVRKNAEFALGWIVDSAAMVLLNAAADAEMDATIQRAMYEAGFRAELALRKHDAMFLISYLESDDRDIRNRWRRSTTPPPCPTHPLAGLARQLETSRQKDNTQDYQPDRGPNRGQGLE